MMIPLLYGVASLGGLWLASRASKVAAQAPGAVRAPAPGAQPSRAPIATAPTAPSAPGGFSLFKTHTRAPVAPAPRPPKVVPPPAPLPPVEDAQAEAEKILLEPSHTRRVLEWLDNNTNPDVKSKIRLSVQKLMQKHATEDPSQVPFAELCLPIIGNLPGETLDAMEDAFPELIPDIRACEKQLGQADYRLVSPPVVVTTPVEPAAVDPGLVGRIMEWLAANTNPDVGNRVTIDIIRLLSKYGTSDPTQIPPVELCRPILGNLPGETLDAFEDAFPEMVPQIRKCEVLLGQADYRLPTVAEKPDIGIPAIDPQWLLDKEAADKKAAVLAKLAAEEKIAERNATKVMPPKAELPLVLAPAPEPVPIVPTAPAPITPATQVAPPPPMVEKPVEPARLSGKQLALALRAYLMQNPTPAAFGYQGHPSKPVMDWQNVEPELTADGMLGPKSRAVARAKYQIEFPARDAVPTSPPAPQPKAEPAPAPVPVAVVPITPATQVAPPPPVVEKPVEPERLTSKQLALALRAFLIQDPTPASFGYKDHPSKPVMDWQNVEAELVADGILGNTSRAVARAKYNIEFPARGAVPAAPPAPQPKAEPAPAPVPVAPTAITPAAQVAPVPVAPAPAPVPVAPAPVAPTVPVGYDPAEAKRLARLVVPNLIKKKIGGYSRQLMKQFQLAAGIAVDGIYGGGSAGALRYYGGKRAPKPFFKPRAIVPYTPPA